MNLDPVAAQLMEMITAGGAPPIELGSPQEARDAFASMSSLIPARESDGTTIDEIEVAGVRCLRIVPELESSGTLVFIHGGGWVIGSADLYLPLLSEIAVGAGCRVIAVDYDKAPEHPFPVAVRQSIAAVSEIALSGGAGTGGGARVAVGGDSAGGNLAAIAAQHVPGLALQLLVYPVCDLRLETASMDKEGEGYFLTAPAMRWFRDLYLAGADPRDPMASPLLADLASCGSLPPAHVVLAGHDPLVDEGRLYAAALEAAGVAVTLDLYPAQMHGFFSMGMLLDDGKLAVAGAIDALRVAFNAG